MSTGVVVALVVAVLVVAAILAAVMLMRDIGGARLKRRFGPEYERTLAGHDGDGRATRQELAERMRRYGGIEPRPLGAQAAERYAARWSALQARFVDEPGAAVADADRLIGRLAAERGLPGAESPGHFEALSVHHPHQVHGYRQAHALAEHAGAGGRRATEDLRRALVASRGLFDALMHGADAPPQIAQADPDGAAEPGHEPAETRTPTRNQSRSQDPDAAESATERERVRLAHRFAALTGGTRPGRSSGPT
jgi:hypothetical protein